MTWTLAWNHSRHTLTQTNSSGGARSPEVWRGAAIQRKRRRMMASRLNLPAERDRCSRDAISRVPHRFLTFWCCAVVCMFLFVRQPHFTTQNRRCNKNNYKTVSYFMRIFFSHKRTQSHAPASERCSARRFAPFSAPQLFFCSSSSIFTSSLSCIGCLHLLVLFVAAANLSHLLDYTRNDFIRFAHYTKMRAQRIADILLQTMHGSCSNRRALEYLYHHISHIFMAPRTHTLADAHGSTTTTTTNSIVLPVRSYTFGAQIHVTRAHENLSVSQSQREYSNVLCVCVPYNYLCVSGWFVSEM